MRRTFFAWVAVVVLASGCGPSTPTTSQGTGPYVPPTQPTPAKGVKPMIE